MAKKTDKAYRTVKNGIVHINSTFNNTLVSITDRNGNVLTWSTAGSCGFKGSRKSTPYAAGIAAEDAAQKATERYNLDKVTVEMRGPGSGRESALRSLQSEGLTIEKIRDVTPLPHNGCRPPKRRRV